MLVELKNITAGYNNKAVILDTNLKVERNAFIGVIGPNGGGKTTLLKVILGILKPMSGEVLYKGSKSNELNIGYLPQITQLDQKFPISVFEVIESGLISNSILPFKRNRIRDKVEKTIKRFSIIELKNRPISELSGGQLQKVLLARAIVSEPELLVLDEPDTYVDNTFEAELHQILSELNKTMAILLVSHDVGMIAGQVNSIACVNKTLHYHPSSEISEELLKAYNCPIDIISHGVVPHRVLKDHKHE